MGLNLKIDPTGIGAIADAVSGVMDRFWPKQMTEEEKAVATIQLRQAIMVEKGQEIADVVSARALAQSEAAEAPWAVKLVRGLLRPYAGFLAVNIWGVSIGLRMYVALATWARLDYALEKAPDLSQLLTAWDFAVVMLILGFFFGTRTIEKNAGTQNRG